jgi:hypothetical protein
LLTADCGHWGFAALARLVCLRCDAAARVLPRQLLPRGRLAGVRRRACRVPRSARRRHPDAGPGDTHRRGAWPGGGRRHRHGPTRRPDPHARAQRRGRVPTATSCGRSSDCCPTSPR